MGVLERRRDSRTTPASAVSSRTSSPTTGFGLGVFLPPCGRAPGYFAYDTMTLIGPGTWEAAREPSTPRSPPPISSSRGAPRAYALCRPPGHHVSPRRLRRLVLPEQRRDRRRGGAAGGPVAVLDVDAHHGNGTQEIFYDRPTSCVASVHVDPAGLFPPSSALRTRWRQ